MVKRPRIASPRPQAPGRRRLGAVRRTAPLALAALLLAAAAAVHAADPPPAAEPSWETAQEGQEPEGWAYDLAGELMSPFCPGVTIAECTSSAASSLKMWMVVQEAAGRSRADVEEELYARYGDQIRAAPKAEGFGLAAYVIPIVAFLGGGALLLLFLRRQTRRGSAPEAATGPARPLDPELARIVDEEIAR